MHSKSSWKEGLVVIIGAIILNLLLLGAAVWVVVQVLQMMGVL